MLSGKKHRFFHWEKFCILVFLFIFISGTGYSQSKYPYWSVSATGGATLPVGSFGDVYDIGGNFGADVVYHIEPYWSVFGNGTYNFLKEKVSGSILSESSYIEVTVGPRYYFTRQKVKAFGEVGIGLYNYRIGGTTTTTVFGTVTTSAITDNNFGMNFGAGVEIPLSKAVDIVGKVKYHAIFTTGATTSYAGFYGGINVNFPFK